MSGVLGKFRVSHDSHGARVIACSPQLTGACSADADIDTAIQMLKDDLDVCASEMKRLIALNSRGSLFEGWPSVGDEFREASS